MAFYMSMPINFNGLSLTKKDYCQWFANIKKTDQLMWITNLMSTQ